MKLPTISIITDSDGKYESVCISHSFGLSETTRLLSKAEKVEYFSTGDICKDYLDCQVFARQFHEAGLPVMLSSSVDHWSFDNDGYGWDIIKAEDGFEYETIVRI